MALSRHDVFRVLARRILRELIEAEAAARIGAGPGERTADARPSGWWLARQRDRGQGTTAVLVEMHDEWIALPRRYLPEGGMDKIYTPSTPNRPWLHHHEGHDHGWGRSPRGPVWVCGERVTCRGEIRCEAAASQSAKPQR
ncbi:hypothetical protein RB200_17415 [Streptomyces sp. PmtG]